MNNEKLLIIILIMNIYIFCSDIFTIIATVWVSTKVKILFFFYFCFSCIHFFCISYIVINFVLRKENCLLHKIISKIPLLMLLSKVFFIFEILILYINSLKFTEYFINCPYLFKDLDNNSSIERRCEQYGKSSNSRYQYQYVCSYDSSKDFIMKLRAKIKPNCIICVRLHNNKETNDILVNLNKENRDYYKYYCHRTNQPSTYSFDKTNKYCKSKVNTFQWISIFLIYIRIIYFFIIIRILKKMAINQNLREINNLLRFLSINLNNLNNNINTSNSTKVTENDQHNGNNEEFVRNNTRNVVIENNQEFSINYDIGDNNKGINPVDIRLSFPNRRGNGINAHNDRSNVHIINNN